NRRARLKLISFEMLDQLQQESIDRVSAGQLSGTDLRAALAWDDSGWNWDFYGPLLEDMFSAGVPVRAGNIDQHTVREIYQGNAAQSILNVLSPEEIQTLTEDVDTSHCGMLPESQFPAMVRVQQARDSRLA